MLLKKCEREREKRARAAGTDDEDELIMTSSASSSSNAAAEKEKEGSSREKSRAEFVSSLIKAMEEAMEMSAAAADDDADSKNADASLAEKCVEKMRFDYPDATRKELERLSESIDLRVLMMTSRDGGGVAAVSYTHLTLPTILRV